MHTFQVNWSELVAESEYKALVKLKDELSTGNYGSVEQGIDAMLQAYSDKIEDALYSEIKILMYNFLLCQADADKKTEQRFQLIETKRNEIEYMRLENPFVDENLLDNILDETFQIVGNQIEVELGIEPDPPTAEELF